MLYHSAICADSRPPRGARAGPPHTILMTKSCAFCHCATSDIALSAQTAQLYKAYHSGGRSSGRVSNRSGVGRRAFRPADSEHALPMLLALLWLSCRAAGVVLACACAPCAVLLVLRGAETPAESARGGNTDSETPRGPLLGGLDL